VLEKIEQIKNKREEELERKRLEEEK